MIFPTLTLPKLIGKMVQELSRFMGGRGETAPGLAILKLFPNFIKNTNKHVPTRVVITGTNGKTTTTNLINLIVQNAKKNVICNNSGSNLLRGVATASLKIQKDTQMVIWEADEAAFVKIVEQVQPTHIVISNLFRDQLDRYGETDAILSKWTKTLAPLKKSEIILNADDPSLVFLANQLPEHHISFYSVEADGEKTIHEDAADSIFCFNCKKPLEYSKINFSHLGVFKCSCGFSHPKPNFLAKIEKMNLSFTKFQINDEIFKIHLIGLYNVYNAIAAITLAKILKIAPEIVETSIANFKPTFGRQEVIDVNGKRIHLMLVKNPTGFNQTLDTLKLMNKKLPIMIVINDRLADGTDVSWLWDVDFEKLSLVTKSLAISGDRTYDMAVRAKYAFLDKNIIKVNSDLSESLGNFVKLDSKDLFILPTYTALWEVRTWLQKRFKTESL